MKLHFFLCCFVLDLISLSMAVASENSEPSPVPSASIAPDGTVRLTRVVPVPATISSEAQQKLRTIKPSPDSHQTLQQHRARVEKWQAEMGEKGLKLYPVKLANDTVAGVPVRVVTPPVITPQKVSRLLINLHGGGFRVDSGSLSETIPIASLTGSK